ncbi:MULTISPECIES: PLP-dependent aminotransferase family protein [unclassified Cobetia]|uniref:aminotransferase-like domain-containing protein n=1 Tax=unclassified Cobetia TaxID=2609414 RepID=UPI00159DDAF5|nr:MULTISPECIES: PLP-dependent aminotransferase family protein [unclassified Cobetia]MCO7231890.1 PLP-dependent aminotransferase family protein [Cobetia sp. Dlab-2-AX]MCO7234794.1 PLP-dependent aminotransferase family protein [Cobetia sp. Dlab-2-U]NVN55343.1 PLP-dependent aminotransferase family protein [bacterium Scap17]
MSSAEHASSASRPSLAGDAINSTTSSTASSGATAATLPRYQQLVERLKAQMATGKLSAGQRLPSLRRQAAQAGLGLNSVIRAYGELEAAGLIIAEPRAGYRVAPSTQAAHDTDDLNTGSQNSPTSSRHPRESQHGQRESHHRPRAITTLTISDPAWQAMANASDPRLAPLGAAHPELDAPAVRRLYRLARTQLGAHAQHPSAYALPPGSSALRTAIAQHLSHHGHPCDSDALLISQGAQHGMSLLLGQLRATKGRCRVGVEAPGYFGIVAAIEAQGHQAIAIPARAHQGLDVAALERLLERHDDKTPALTLDALIVTADGHNPLGGQLSTPDRHRLLALAARHAILLVENTTFAELSFDTRQPWLADLAHRHADRPMPALISLGSFSKTLDPRTRCGWLWLSRPEQESPLGLQAMIRARWANGMGDMPWMHAALSELITSGDYGRHVQRMRRCYAKRLERLRAHLSAALGDSVWLPPPSGGYLQWCGLPSLEARQLEQLHQDLLNAGIATLPGSLFNVEQSGLRLNAAQLGEEATQNAARSSDEIPRQQDILARLTTHLQKALAQGEG